MPATAFAPAKVNLFLHVGAPAADGFHPLCSWMVFASVGDEVASRSAQAFSLEVKGRFGSGLGDQADNLVVRAARALADRLSVPLLQQAISLTKNLPIAAGLGGGSSDAGAALRLLRDVMAADLPDDVLEAIAADLGSDGLACFRGRSVLAQGRGEQLSEAPRLPDLWGVLVNPGVAVSTPAVYRQLDTDGVFGDVVPPAAPTSFAAASDLVEWLADTRNDLQAPAIKLAPAIDRVLKDLARRPLARLSRMSGSGATCFALCAGAGEAARLASDLQADFPNSWIAACAFT